MVEWHAIPKEEILGILKTSESGLSEHEAHIRLSKFGKNELRQISRISPTFIFLEQFKSIFILILIAAALFSFFIGHYTDFFVIIIIVLLNSFIGFIQQYKAEKTISKMKSLLVPHVFVFRNNQLKEIFSTELVPGDIIQISEGDKIMADCRVIHNNEIQTNEAILTGESFPQNKSSETLRIDLELSNRENMIYMGTTIVRGSGKAIVVSTGMNTEFGKIAGLVQEIKKEKTPLEKKLDDFSKKVAVIILVLSALSIFIGYIRGEPLSDMILTGVALAISVIPEGVPAIIAITLAIAIVRMQKHNSLIRKLPAAETLGRTTVICTDKTGTLTEEEMTVAKIYCGKNYFTIKNNSVLFENKKINPLEDYNIKMLLKIGAICNNARIEKSNSGKILRVLGDPTEKAILFIAEKLGIFIDKTELRLKEYSFSSKRKLMSVVSASNNAIISYVKGAPDILLKKSTKEFIDGRITILTEKRREELLLVYENLASSALRVLGFAYKLQDANFNQESSENGLVFVGFQGLIDPPRKEVAEAVKECLAAGISIKMITGDSVLTAKAISDQIGLDGDSISEHELLKLSEKEFSDTVKNKTIFARITPETKLRIIKSLREQGEIVAVTGDGVNDVLALKQAHISVAMGIRGTDVAREVSDIVLLDDNFNSIVSAVREGRRVYDNLKKSIKSHLAANVGELFIVLFALLLYLPLPLMPLAILWMNLITDSLPSLSLAVEPAEKDIMKRKPISKKENILTGMLGFISLAGLFSFIASIGLFFLFYESDLSKARTIALTTAIFCEMFVVISCRSEKNIWKIGFFTNKFLIFSVLTAIVLQLIAIYTPLSLVFGFEHLSFVEILLILAVSFPIFIIFEIKKYFSGKSKKEI
jgi:Ca2+-transporting ATPase